MSRVMLDEDFPHPVGHELRALGHDVLTPADVGRAGKRIPDDQVLAFATSVGRAVLTINQWDFVRLHRANARHAGIVVCTYDLNFVALAARIDCAIRSASPLAGTLIRVKRPNRVP